MRLKYLVAALCLWTSQPSFADSSEELYTKASKLEDAATTVEQLEKAKEYYFNATKLGNVDSYNGLGRLAIRLKQPKQAHAYFKQASDKGDALGSYNLGMLASQQRRQADAIKYLNMAGKQGYGGAYAALGDLYATNSETPDIKRAEVYYQQGAALNDETSINRLALLYLLKDGNEAADDSDNAKKTMQLIERVANNGNAQALYILSMAYENGFMRPVDHDKAHTLLKKAADLGYVDAVYTLGYVYLLGLNIPQDATEGVKYMSRAADMGFPDALNNLGMLYIKGELVEKDTAKGIALLTRADNSGNSLSAFNLGQVYEKGIGVEPDMEKALVLYTKSAQAGYGPAMTRIARYLGEIGNGEDARAREWLEKAIDSGDEDAWLLKANAYQFGKYGYLVDKPQAQDMLNKARESGSTKVDEIEQFWKQHQKRAVN